MSNATTTTLHVLGVEPKFQIPYVEKVLTVLGCEKPGDVLSLFYVPEIGLKIVLANMKEKDLKFLKIQQHIMVDNQILPVLINEETIADVSSMETDLQPAVGDVIPSSRDRSLSAKPTLRLPSDESYLQIGENLNVTIFVGDIRKERVHAIVNSVYETKETFKNSKNGKETYVIGATDYHWVNEFVYGGIIDINLPSYDPSTSDPESVLAPTLQKCYENCLGLANFLKLPSIAFQPLACGSVFISAISATRAVLNLLTQDRLGSVEDVRFVTPSRDFARIFVEHFTGLIDELKANSNVKVSVKKGKPAKRKIKTEFSEGEPSTSDRHKCLAETRVAIDGPQPKKFAYQKTEDNVTDKKVAVAPAVPHVEECSVCLEDLDLKTQTKILWKCSHKFHIVCIDQWMAKKNSCPLCQTDYSMPNGNQPDGEMVTKIFNRPVPGFTDSKRCIEILYSFPRGIQGPNHPHPGVPYLGASYVAYLPNNSRGQMIEKLLRKAFQCKLVFTIGSSLTSDKQDTVVWSTIHHKTALIGAFGYPDPNYLDRVEADLKIVGIEKSML